METENMLERATVELYICDPEKDTECEKSNCKTYGNGECELTTKREAAKLNENGKPIVYSIEEWRDKTNDYFKSLRNSAGCDPHSRDNSGSHQGSRRDDKEEKMKIQYEPPKEDDSNEKS